MELTKAVLARIEAQEPKVHAFVTVDAEGALKAAADADARRAKGESGALLGIPLAIKDNMSTRGLRTTCSSKMLDNYVPPFDATVIARLRAEGAIVIGKANLDEFAMGSSTENSAYGPTKNPWNLGTVPGGSSAAAQRPRPLRTSAWAPWARTPAARSASLRRFAALWGSSPPMAASRAMA